VARFALSGYAIAFTIAYTRIGAAVGALLLFGAVQTTMIAAACCEASGPGAPTGWASRSPSPGCSC
jgi:hypothetical protein